MSVLHIPIMHAHNVSNKQKIWKCYKTIGSPISCAFIEIWSTWEVWRALKKLELLLATPRATLMHLLCSPNFPRALYLDEHMLTYEPFNPQHITDLHQDYAELLPHSAGIPMQTQLQLKYIYTKWISSKCHLK